MFGWHFFCQTLGFSRGMHWIPFDMAGCCAWGGEAETCLFHMLLCILSCTCCLFFEFEAIVVVSHASNMIKWLIENHVLTTFFNSLPNSQAKARRWPLRNPRARVHSPQSQEGLGKQIWDGCASETAYRTHSQILKASSFAMQNILAWWSEQDFYYLYF